ncbi:unnamed protein product, partial [Iphiclides podalirius]
MSAWEQILEISYGPMTQSLRLRLRSFDGRPSDGGTAFLCVSSLTGRRHNAALTELSQPRGITPPSQFAPNGLPGMGSAPDFPAAQLPENSAAHAWAQGRPQTSSLAIWDRFSALRDRTSALEFDLANEAIRCH